jgi:hypothetical protein
VFRKPRVCNSGWTNLIVQWMLWQVMAEDREMARQKLGFPLLVAAHDHDAYVEQLEGCWIVKTGCDASQAAIIDISWPSADTPGDKPEVEVKLVKCSEYPKSQVALAGMHAASRPANMDAPGRKLLEDQLSILERVS